MLDDGGLLERDHDCVNLAAYEYGSSLPFCDRPFSTSKYLRRTWELQCNEQKLHQLRIESYTPSLVLSSNFLLQKVRALYVQHIILEAVDWGQVTSWHDQHNQNTGTDCLEQH